MNWMQVQELDTWGREFICMDEQKKSGEHDKSFLASSSEDLAPRAPPLVEGSWSVKWDVSPLHQQRRVEG